MGHGLRLQLHYELDEDGNVPPGGGDALAKRASVPTYLAVRPLTGGDLCSRWARVLCRHMACARFCSIALGALCETQLSMPTRMDMPRV